MCTSQGLRKDCFERECQGQLSLLLEEPASHMGPSFQSLDLEQQLVLEAPLTLHSDSPSHLQLCINPQAAMEVARPKLINFPGEKMEEGQVPAEKGGQELDLPTQEACCILSPALDRDLNLQGQGHRDA